jgi:hypothetical protein
MVSDLFTAIAEHLERHAETSRRRDILHAAMARTGSEFELWAALRPFLRSAHDHRAAAAFLAEWTRQRARD